MLTALLLQKLSRPRSGIPYSEPLLRRVLDSAIRPMYEEQGRIRVAFPEITAKKAENNDGVVVTIAVNEGPAYTLGTVAVAGLPAAEVEQLAKSEDWHKGETANFTKIDANLDKIRQRQRAQGYLRAQYQRGARHPRRGSHREPDGQRRARAAVHARQTRPFRAWT